MDESQPMDHQTTDDAAHGGAHAVEQATTTEHGHESEALGPIDWTAWGAGAVGVLLGLVVAGCLVLTTSVLPSAY